MDLRRTFLVVTAVGLVFLLIPGAGNAQKKKKKNKQNKPVTKVVRAEGTSWYWASQQSTAPSDITEGCPPQFPVCPDQRVPLPNPHSSGALPIQISQGADEKLSAILFDLSFLPDRGATVDTFTFSVTESPDGRDQSQTVNAAGKTIEACQITDVWPPSEDGAEDTENAPSFSCVGAVEGTRDDETDPARWEFDITSFAETWAADPPSFGEPRNYGVMLVGQKAAGESWQLVLKGPRRDDPVTADVNEETANATNIEGSIVYTANPKEKKKKKSAADDAGNGPDASPPTSTTPVTTTPSVPSTSPGDFGFGDEVTGVDTAPVVEPVAEEVPALETVATEETAPSMPGYVWILLPLGLLSLSMVRSAILEPVTGKRPDGVVAMIRERNAAKRGVPVAPAAANPIDELTRGLRRIGRRIRGGARGLAKSVRSLMKRSGK